MMIIQSMRCAPCWPL